MENTNKKDSDTFYAQSAKYDLKALHEYTSFLLKKSDELKKNKDNINRNTNL